jgi:hypothetical protein
MQWGAEMGHRNCSLFRRVSMAKRLERLTTERATCDRFQAPVKFVFLLFFSFLFLGIPGGSGARGVINPVYLVIEVLMHKTLFHHLVNGYTSSPVNKICM